MDVEVRKSRIHSLGVFALRPFLKGEVILRWDTSQRVARERSAGFAVSPDVHLHPYDSETSFIVQSPECYVNHSCDHNTEVIGYMDVAVRDIAVGEEITSNYETDGAGLSFLCSCGAANCRGRIGAVAS